MTALLDVNVLVALSWPNHLHHGPALKWFRQHQQQGWATCPLTESGFVRVSSNRRVIPEAKSVLAAVAQLRRMTSLSSHEFWIDDQSIARSDLFAPEKLLGYRQVTDAHLVAIAIRHGGRLASFDRGVVDILPGQKRAEDVLILIPT
jgi:toxin-antitoxin system PIN domain toxin